MPARENGALGVIPGSHCGGRDLVGECRLDPGSGGVVVGVLDRVRLP
jgi:hypothetical protein